MQNLSSPAIGNSMTETTPAVFTTAEFVIIRFFLGLFSFVGLAENIAVIVAISTSEILRDIPSNLFVLSLAVADAFFCVVSSVVFTCVTRTTSLTQNVASVHYLRYLFSPAFLGSTSNLFLLIFNRFLSIYDSLKYPTRMTPRRAKGLILFVWSFVFSLAFMNAVSMFFAFFSVFYLCVGKLTTTALNIYLLKKARDQHKAIARLHSSVMTGQKRSIMNEYRTFLRLVGVTCTSFFASVYSFISWYLRKKYYSRGSTSFQLMFAVGFILIAFNSVIHPLVYFITSPEFRRIASKVKSRLLRRSELEREFSQRNQSKKDAPFVVRRVAPAETADLANVEKQ